MSNKFSLNVALTITICILLVIGIGVWRWLKPGAPQVVFQLSQDFNGPFVVVVPESIQVPPLPARRAYIFEVPANGIVFAKDDRVFSEWHIALARRDHGARVSISLADEPDPHQDIFKSEDFQKDGILRVHWYYFGVPNVKADDRKRREIEKALDKFSDALETPAASDSGE